MFSRLVFFVSLYLLSFSLNLLSASSVIAATAGPFTAGTAAGTNWTTPGNTTGSDNSDASYNNTAQDDLKLTNFGFAIPANNIIDGIEVEREASGAGNSPSTRQYRIGLTKDGTALAGTRKTAQSLPKSTDDTVTVGTNSDQWGTTWTAAEINSANFGVLISDNDTSASALDFDRIRVTVTHHAPTTTIGDGAAPASKNVAPSGTNNAVSTFTLSTDNGNDTLTALTVTFSGTSSGDVAASGVKIYKDVNGDSEYDTGDTLITNGTASFSGNTATFSSLSEGITTASTQYLITYDIAAGATLTNTLQASVTAATVTNAMVNNDNADATLTVVAVATIVGDGTAPANKDLYPSGTNYAVSAFTLATNSGTDTLTALIVTFSGTSSSDVAASGVKIFRDVNGDSEWDAGDTLITNGTASFSGNTATFSSLSEAIDGVADAYIITYDIVASPGIGNTLQGAVTSATVTTNDPPTISDTNDATLTVASTCSVTASDAASLRTCISWANGNPGTDTIIVPAGTYNLTGAGTAEDLNVDGDLDITESVIIDGAGMTSTIIDAAGLLDERAVHITAGDVTFTDLTIRNATNAAGYGAGIWDEGTSLTLTRVSVSGNTNSTAHGGGIYTSGTLTMTDFELHNNRTDNGSGGGIYSLGATLIWNGGTASNNTCTGTGGGIRSGGSLDATNVTFSGNSAVTSGSAMSSSTTTLTNVTIYGNGGAASDAYRQDAGSTTMKNTLIANNSNTKNCNTNNITSLGGNLETDSDTCMFTDGTDQVSVTLANLNIDATLSDNGGYTKTHALLAGSYAVDAGITSGAPATDQRGTSRGSDGNGTPNNPQPGDYDVGAYELDGGATTISGTAYTDEGVTAIGSGKTVRLLVNGASSGTDITDGSGIYSISATISAGDAILVFLEDDPGYKGSTVTVSNGASLNDLDIYTGAADATEQGRVIVRHDNGGNMTSALMDTALGAYSDTDIQFSVPAGVLTMGIYNDLYIPAGHTFVPGADTDLDGVKLLGSFTGGSFTHTVRHAWNAATGTYTAGNSTLKFFCRPTGNGFVFNPGASNYYDVDLDTAERSFGIGGNITATNSFTLSSSTGPGFGTAGLGTYSITTKDFVWSSGYIVHAAGAAFNCSGNFSHTSGDFIIGDGGGLTLTFSGSGNATFTPGPSTFGNLEVNKATSSDSVQISTDPLTLAASSTLHITSGVLDLNGQNLDIGSGSSFSNTGTLRLQGGETVSNLANDTDSGAVTYNGGGAYADLKVGGSYYHLNFNGSGSWTQTAPVSVNGDFAILSGTFDSNNQDVTVTGNWGNAATYTSGTNTVNLNGTNQSISGSTTFNNLTKSVAAADTLTFEAGATQAINGTATLNGASGQLLSLVSDTPGTKWNFTLNAGATKSISFVDVHDSNASGSDASQKPVNPATSNDGGTNIDWFGPAATTTIGDGTAPANQTSSINSTNNAVSTFTLATDSGSDTLTSITITRTGGADADVAASGVKLWRDDGGTPNAWDATDTPIGSGASFSSGTATINSISEAINTTPTPYLITYDIASTATGGNTLQGAVTAVSVSNTVVNNDNTDATLTVGNCQVINTNTSGAGSLDACILYANSNPGTTISFNIPTSDGGYQPDPGDGNRWWKISPTAAYSITANGTIIDATTQTTNQGNKNLAGPEIEIDGSSAGDVHGFELTSNSNTIKGFVINGYNGATYRAAVAITGDSNTVAGNYLGPNYKGTASPAPAAQNKRGVDIQGGGQFNIIGGTDAADRNIISHNSSFGVVIQGSTSDSNEVKGNYIGTGPDGAADVRNGTGVLIEAGPQSNTIGGSAQNEGNVISWSDNQGIYIKYNAGLSANSNIIKGNYIGTDSSGTLDCGNTSYGIVVERADDTVIGGTGDYEHNIISGNDWYGIYIYAGSKNTIVKGNYIGTKADGWGAMGNTQYGVVIYGNSGDVSGTEIGGANPDEGNVIAHTTGAGIGIVVAEGDSLCDDNKISGNSIFTNTGLGIDLWAGANGDKAAPTISSITPNASDFDVTVTTTSGDTVEFFRVNNAAAPAVTADGSGAGEGYLFLGSCTDGGGACAGPYISGTDGAADGSMTVTLTSGGFSGGDLITATATDGTNGTSEFATNATAPAGVSISGKVFEDANFAGTAAEYENETNDKALANVDVELYDNSDVYQDSTTTDANGDFSFSGLADGTYKVRVRSATIADSDTTPKGGLNGTVPATWPYPLPEMTWGNGAAVYGGQSATVDDTDTGANAGPGDTWVSVTVSGANVTGVNFGFAYNLIVNKADDGNADNALSQQGSLRQFMKNANAIGTAGSTTANSSEFRIPAGQLVAGVASITPSAAALPAISDTTGGTTLSAVTQTTNIGETNANGPEIEIDGGGGSPGYNGLEISSSNNTIKGLIIGGFNGGGYAGIQIDDGNAAAPHPSNNTIAGNYLGTNPSGTAANANNHGISIINGAQSNTIGGSVAADRNVISGNVNHGVRIAESGTASNVITGNYIGTNASGTGALGNSYGVYLSNSTTGNIVGGSTAGERNIISGNTVWGIRITGAGTDSNTVKGNYIGTDVSGTAGVPNATNGVNIDSTAQNNVIGGFTSGEENLIAYNGDFGIRIASTGTDGSIIRLNEIRDNGRDGIRLAAGNNAKIYHNTIHNNGTDAGAANGDGIYIAAGITGTIIRNSIMSDNDGYGINTASVVTNSSNLHHNNSSGATNGCPLGTGSLIADPQYVDDVGGDFSLTECSSPAINTGADLAGDQPDMNGGSAGLFNGPAPERGAFESSCVNSPPDVVIDGDFSDWCDGSGVEICVDDQGGADDWTSPNRLDITRFGVATNQTDTFYVLFGFDDTSLSQPATACAMMDTDSPPNDNVDRVLCAVIDGASSAVSSVDLYTCDDSISGGCGNASLSKTYAVSEYNSSNSVTGPFGGTDTFVEVAMPFADLGLGSDTVILTSLISYPGGSFLKSPKDSIFGDTEQNYDDRVIIDTETGGGGTVGAPGTPVIAGNVFIDEGSVVIGAGKTVHLLVGGSSVGTDTTDDFGGYFFSTAVSAGQSLLAYIDNDGSYQGTSVSVSDGGNLTDFDIYASHLITRHDNGGVLSNTLLNTAKGGSGDTDILYTINSGNLDVSGTGTELYVPASYSFTPGGNVTSDHLKNLGTFNGGSVAIDINGTLTIAGGTFTSTSGTMTIEGDFAYSGGSFVHSSGTVTLDGSGQAITGSTTFHHLNKTVGTTDTLTFTAGATTTVEGTCTLQGAAGNLLALRSATPGTRWNLTLPAGAAKAISYVDVQDSDASGSDAGLLVINPANSTSSGNNLSWFLPLLTITKTASTPTANPGAVITYTVLVANTGAGEATDVVLDDHLSPYTAWSLDAFGASTPFEFTDGAPSSALTLGTSSYSDDDGGSYTYTLTSTGGGAPAGYDGNVTNWKIPMTGTMDSGGSFTLKYKVMVE